MRVPKIKTWHVIAAGGVATLAAFLWPKKASAAPAVKPTPGYVPPAYTPPAAPAMRDPDPPLPGDNELPPPNIPGSDWRPSDPNVSWVQSRLIELGFDPGPVDGLMGPKTRAGIRAYQADLGLPATGELDENTLEHLQGIAPAERPLYTY